MKARNLRGELKDTQDGNRELERAVKSALNVIKRRERGDMGPYGDTPKERAEAESLAAELWPFLKKDPEHKDRRQTASGTKTKLGLLRTVRAAIERGGDKE